MTLVAIDRFLSNSPPVPLNQKGQLGVFGLMLALPVAVFSIDSSLSFLTWWVTVSAFLVSPYFSLILVIGFFPLALTSATGWRKLWIEEYVKYEYFTLFFSIVAGVLLILQLRGLDAKSLRVGKSGLKNFSRWHRHR